MLNYTIYATLLALLVSSSTQAIDPKLKALGSLAVGAIAMTAAKKMENYPFVQKISRQTGLDSVDIAGVVGVSAGCLTLSCITNNELAPVFTKYAVRAPLAGILGYLITSDVFNDVLVNAPLVGEFLARKSKNYVLKDENGNIMDATRCKLISDNGQIERITGHTYNSNYRCRGTIISAACYLAVDAGINALVKKYPAFAFLNGE